MQHTNNPDMWRIKQVVARKLVSQLIASTESEALQTISKLLDHVEENFIEALEIAYMFSEDLPEASKE